MISVYIYSVYYRYGVFPKIAIVGPEVFVLDQDLIHAAC